MPMKKLRIGELLVRDGLISEVQLKEALIMQQEKGGKVVANLISLHHLDTSDFLKFLSRQPGVASIDIQNYTVPREILDLVPADFVAKHEILPIDKMGRELTIVMACPLDAKTIEDLEALTGLKVRPLLVSLLDIGEAIAHYYPQAAQFELVAPPEAAEEVVDTVTLARAENTLNFEVICQLIRELKTLPALPETVAEVQRKMEDLDSSTADIARVVAKDPALTAKVIGLANSSAYGFSHRVDSVEMAATLLGLREVYAIVLGSSVVDYFEHSKFFDYKAYWRRSLCCATASRIIAKACGYKDQSWVFTAGLLHDLGRTVCAEVMPDRYVQMTQDLSHAALIQHESELLGIAHPEVGYILANEWDLPHEISEPMRYHHEPALATENRELVFIVALAASLAENMDKLDLDNVAALVEENEEKLQFLHLDADRLTSIVGVTSAMLASDFQ
jgi:HD-like signal output (HDOD) protein